MLKHFMTTFMLLGLWHTAAMAEGPVVLDSDNDKVNYSLGYEAGKDLKREDLELKPEVLLQGAKDATEGNKPLVSPKARRTALQEIKNKRTQENLEKSLSYIKENGKKEGVVTRPSGLQYKEIQAGEGKTPGEDSIVTVQYRGRLIDGSEFDSSYKREKPSKYKLSNMIPGWKEAIQLMKEGAKWELYIPPDLAYGKLGRGKTIPPNSALIFEVELISVE